MLMYSKHHVCWWPTNTWSQAISRYDTDIAPIDHFIASMIRLIRHDKGPLTPGRYEWKSISYFQADFSNWWLRHLLWNCPQMITTGPGDLVNIGSGNGLVPSGNRPLPEPMLTQSSCQHMVSLHESILQICMYNTSQKLYDRIVIDF